MRYPAEHKEETHARIVREASRQFRRQGGEALAIAELMQKLKLTHGGFYRHFGSKESLLAEASTTALCEATDTMAAVAKEVGPANPLKAIIAAYLSPENCLDVAGGCPLGGDTAPLA
jgi:TetR/AcrR family transcriptional regulator, transcriptional repressor for nem operon